MSCHLEPAGFLSGTGAVVAVFALEVSSYSSTPSCLEASFAESCLDLASSRRGEPGASQLRVMVPG